MKANTNRKAIKNCVWRYSQRYATFLKLVTLTQITIKKVNVKIGAPIRNTVSRGGVAQRVTAVKQSIG